MGFPATPILDDFNRANEGPPPSSSYVTSSGDGHKVDTNQCCTHLAGGASTWNTQFGANQECHFKVPTLPPDTESVTVFCRLQTANDYLSDHYEAVLVIAVGVGDVLQIWERSGAVWTQLGADVNIVDLVANDQVGVRVVGDTIETYLQGTLLATRTDSTVTGPGYVGFYETHATPRIDDFGGGNYRSGSLTLLGAGA